MNHALPTSLDTYRLLGNSGLRVSPLCLGTMNFGDAWPSGVDEAASREIFDGYAEAGGNFVDTANLYTNGQSEQFTGRFLADHGRDRFVLATKYGNNPLTNAFGGTEPDARPDPNAGGVGRLAMIRSIEGSLRRLGTDRIDLFWVHTWDFTTPADELMRGLDDLVRQGKVVHVAISDTPAWKVSQLQQYATDHGLSRFVAYQSEYSLLTRDAEREILPMSRELGLGVLPWSPLAQGVLAGKYDRGDLEKQGEEGVGSRGVQLTERMISVSEAVKEVASEVGQSASQVSLNWLLGRAGVASVLVGARKRSHLDDSLGCLGFSLSEAQREKLDKASAIELGFPHDFLRQTREGIVFGKAKVEAGTPQTQPAGS